MEYSSKRSPRSIRKRVRKWLWVPRLCHLPMQLPRPHTKWSWSPWKLQSCHHRRSKSSWAVQKPPLWQSQAAIGENYQGPSDSCSLGRCIWSHAHQDAHQDVELLLWQCHISPPIGVLLQCWWDPHILHHKYTEKNQLGFDTSVFCPSLTAQQLLKPQTFLYYRPNVCQATEKLSPGRCQPCDSSVANVSSQVADLVWFDWEWHSNQY